MITTLLLKGLITVVYGVSALLTPILPSFITQAFGFMTDYIISGCDFIFMFFHKTHLISIFAYWVAFKGVFLIVDIIRWVLSFISGNKNAAEN